MVTTREKASPIDAADEELIDTLIAISVVAKRLAANLRQKRIQKVWCHRNCILLIGKTAILSCLFTVTFRIS